MMDSENTVCPVCTLYLRPGITLKAHLSSHPKQRVIDALVNLTNCRNEIKEVAVPSPPPPEVASSSQTSNQNWNQAVTSFPPMPGNHSFIYQQFMSTTSQPPPNVVNVNPLAQQYITIPAVFNPQMMCQPYLYHQQQQVIMSAGTTAVSSLPPLLRKPPLIDLSNDTETQIQDQEDVVPIDENINTMEMQNDDSNSIKETSKDDEDDGDVIIIGGQIPSSNDLREMEIMRNDDPVPVSLVRSEASVSMSLEKDLKSDQKLEGKGEKKEEENEEELEVMEDHIHEEFHGHEDNLGSPASSTGSDYLRVRTDLNKACQTQQLSQMNPLEDMHLADEADQDNTGYFTSRTQDSNATPPDILSLQGPFEHDMNYTQANINVVQPNDQVIDMDGMQLVLCNDFMGSQLISQVEDFECINNRSERTVLMNIGGMDGGAPNTFAESNVNVEHLGEESISRESTNMSIRADEHMPPRGELSGQESNGATSDIAWNRIQYEGSSATSTSYDLLARETWEGSDCSDSEVPPLQSRIPPHILYSSDMDDTPTIVSVTEPPLNFKCPVCGQGFKCPKERRVHQTEVHSDKTGNNKSSVSDIKVTNGTNIIGSKLGNKKPIKKLVIKPKKAEIKSENNFDNVFTNRLKIDSTAMENSEEREEERASVIAAVRAECDLDDKKDVKYCVCPVCDMVFPDNRTLKRHKQQLHGKGYGARYRCDTCGETLLNEVKYNEHLRNHPLECRLCGKYFYRRQNLQLHMKRHLGIKPYVCEFCQKSFLTKQKLDEHKNIHTGEAPIKCNMCDETFRRHSNLVQHRNRHHLNIKRKVKDYICFCGEILHSKKKLAWHKEIHDSKPKACSQCNEKFVHMASLTRHMRRAHNERFVPKEERSNENVECPICKGVYLRSSLEVHIRNHSGHRPFTCLICNKDFTTKWNLKLHKWTHAARASKPFKCDQCKGAFIRETDYVAHMNSHKSVRPYTCNHCGAQFIRKYNCQRHVREHEKAKTFSCQVCGKSFHRSYYLKDHMRVHSGLRPFSCHICGKTSTTKSNHNKHVMIHHAKEPVSTEN